MENNLEEKCNDECSEHTKTNSTQTHICAEKSYNDVLHRGGLFSEIVINGAYYYPAWKRYYEYAYISCDRCTRRILDACIGYKEYDLCLSCANDITRHYCNNECCDDDNEKYNGDSDSNSDDRN